MEKYSVITQKTGCHSLVDALQRSIVKTLTANPPSEVLVQDNKFFYSKRGMEHGETVHKQILEAKEQRVLILDQDVLILKESLVQKALEIMKDPSVFCCHTYEHSFDGIPLPVPPFVMLNKNLYLKNQQFFKNTGYDCFKGAYDNKLKMVKIEPEDQIYHFGSGCRSHYFRLFVTSHWETSFEKWKKATGSSAVFTDYVCNDGMDIEDHQWLNHHILSELRTTISRKTPFSLMRLGDLNLRFFSGYLDKTKDFPHICNEHPDIAMPSPKVGEELAAEMIPYLNNANYIDHPELYKGVFNPLYRWRSPLGRCSEIYAKLGITNQSYCCSLQSYLSVVKGFEINLYQVLKDKKVFYIGPWDGLKTVIEKKKLQVSEYNYYPLSMSANHNERYVTMNNALKGVDINYWDVFIICGSVYGRIINGRIKRAGGRAFDLGQASNFALNNIFELCFETTEDRTMYTIKNNFKTEEKIWDGKKNE